MPKISFAPNVIWGSPMIKIYIFGGQKCPFVGQMHKFAKTHFWLQMLPKVIWGSSVSKIGKHCIFGESKMLIWESKMPIFAHTKFSAPKAPKSHLGIPMTKICKISIFGGSKMPKVKKKIVSHQMSPKVIWGSPMTKICIFGFHKCPFGGLKMPKFANKMFCFKCSQMSVGDLP